MTPQLASRQTEVVKKKAQTKRKHLKSGLAPISVCGIWCLASLYNEITVHIYTNSRKIVNRHNLLQQQFWRKNLGDIQTGFGGRSKSCFSILTCIKQIRITNNTISPLCCWEIVYLFLRIGTIALATPLINHHVQHKRYSSIVAVSLDQAKVVHAILRAQPFHKETEQVRVRLTHCIQGLLQHFLLLQLIQLRSLH